MAGRLPAHTQGGKVMSRIVVTEPADLCRRRKVTA
jgi:hypothetical protein